MDAYRRFQNRNFDFITISMDPVADEAKVQKFLQKQTAALSDKSRMREIRPSGSEGGAGQTNASFIERLLERLKAEKIDGLLLDLRPDLV